MKQMISFLLLLLPLAGAATDDKGMHFEHALTWKQILAKAKAENKYIFVDCFTTWCGPCKHMSNTIFPAAEAGTFMNDRFINVKLQIDQTPADGAEVKRWYADAETLARTWHINAFPTFLYFAPDGNIVHRATGAYSTVPQFITAVREALDSNTQFYTLLQKVQRSGGRDTATVRKLSELAYDSYDRPLADSLSSLYISQQDNLFTRDKMEYVFRMTNSRQAPQFSLFLSRKAAVDSLLGKGKAMQKIIAVAMDEEMERQSLTGENLPDEAAIKDTLAVYFPQDKDELFAFFQLHHAFDKGQWGRFDSLWGAFLRQYPADLSTNVTGMYAYTVFNTCTDSACIAHALQRTEEARKTPEGEKMLGYPYACLLYKAGHKAEAIAQVKAMLQPDAGPGDHLRQTLEQMEKGAQIWEK